MRSTKKYLARNHCRDGIMEFTDIYIICIVKPISGYNLSNGEAMQSVYIDHHCQSIDRELRKGSSFPTATAVKIKVCQM